MALHRLVRQGKVLTMSALLLHQLLIPSLSSAFSFSIKHAPKLSTSSVVFRSSVKGGALMRMGESKLDIVRTIRTTPHRLCLDHRWSFTPVRMSTSSSSTTDEPLATTGAKDPPKAVKAGRIKRTISGVQPTGVLHLGNYLGAMRQWIDLQDNYTRNNINDKEIDGTATNGSSLAPVTENFFFVVDLHAITVPQDPAALSESTRTSVALYLAAGIDPTKSKIFVQSHVSAHAELCWLLQCITPMNWLERMIQFKEKARKQGESVGTGLFTYPVLMAADILLFQADEIPVGEDQRQHLELARDLCRRFHEITMKSPSAAAYKKRMTAAGLSSRPVFTEPTAVYQPAGGARIMSLTDGTSKMSKSDPSDNSRINILDPPDVVRDKVKRCKTDAMTGIEWDNPDRPEATNLLNIYSAVLPPGSFTRQEIIDKAAVMTWGEFKPLLAEAIIDHLAPIQERYKQIRADGDAYLDQVLWDGALAANAVASQTLYAAKVAMGIVVPKPPQSSSTTLVSLKKL